MKNTLVWRGTIKLPYQELDDKLQLVVTKKDSDVRLIRLYTGNGEPKFAAQIAEEGLLGELRWSEVREVVCSASGGLMLNPIYACIFEAIAKDLTSARESTRP